MFTFKHFDFSPLFHMFYVDVHKYTILKQNTMYWHMLNRILIGTWEGVEENVSGIFNFTEVDFDIL